ncbi:MAG: Vps62-related protein [Chloroflexi bacterium]|nr:Vps62-related protein [Chloroflexota bacterium]
MPLYAKVNEHADYTELVYMLCFSFGAWQLFRAKLFRTKTLSYITRNFEWRDFAGHEGDWEHITVRISNAQQNIFAVYYARHHDGDWPWVIPGDPDA